LPTPTLTCRFSLFVEAEALLIPCPYGLRNGENRGRIGTCEPGEFPVVVDERIAGYGMLGPYDVADHQGVVADRQPVQWPEQQPGEHVIQGG
jgi:hypothetical protein